MNSPCKLTNGVICLYHNNCYCKHLTEQYRLLQHHADMTDRNKRVSGVYVLQDCTCLLYFFTHYWLQVNAKPLTVVLQQITYIYIWLMGYRMFILLLLSIYRYFIWCSRIELVSLYCSHMSKWFRLLVGFANVNKYDLLVCICNIIQIYNT